MFPEALLTLLAALAGAEDVDADIATINTVTVEQYTQFPRLFHLDDYENCLLKEDGVYCLGVFQLLPDGHNPTYDLMQKYSEDIHNFNRTFIHRGYCVSSRCPSPRDAPADAPPDVPTLQHPSHRFARCVAHWGKKGGFRTRLHKLDYCITHKEHVTEKWNVELPHRAFLWVLALILMMNVIGTVHDATTVDGKKNKLLTAWSVQRNWQHLVGPFPADDPRLAALLPVEALRVILMLLVIFLHSGCIHDMMYIQNPRFIEQMSHHPVLMFLQNGSSVIQIFILLSSFFLAQGLLQEKELSFRMLPKLLLKRIVRIAPVYVLAVGFAATWWPLSRDGPQWAALVGAESAACRDKFWPLAFFVGNLVRDDQTCLIQTWFIGVDLQLYVLSALLTVLLARCRWVLHVLAAMFVAACVASAVAAHSYGWQPLMLVTGPEAVRGMFSNIESFRMFYTKPWGSVPASLVGLFMAHLMHRLENRFNAEEHKTLIILCQLCVPLLPLWTFGAGNLLRGVTGWGAAVYLALERPVMCLLSAPLLFGALNGNGRKIDRSAVPTSKPADKEKSPVIKGFLHRVFCWRGWYALGRMSLAVLMLHWCVNTTFAVSRPGLLNSTTLDMTVDFAATAVFTYVLAAPLTLLVDIPSQQLFKALTT